MFRRRTLARWLRNAVYCALCGGLTLAPARLCQSCAALTEKKEVSS